MTGGEGYVVDCRALRTHADAVGQVAELLDKASAAAQPVSVEAFGVIGRPFAGSLITAGTAAAGAIAGLARAARADAAGLTSTEEAYRRQEAEQGREFDRLHRAGEPR